MRCTCHQRDQLVSPLGTQARIIICMRLEIGDDFLVGFIGFCIYKLIEFKAVLRYIVHSVPKGCDHLIGALLIFQVQQNFRVGLPLFLQIGQKPHDLGLLLRLGTGRSLWLPLRPSGGLHRRLRLRSRCPGGLCIALRWPLQLLFPAAALHEHTAAEDKNIQHQKGQQHSAQNGHDRFSLVRPMGLLFQIFRLCFHGFSPKRRWAQLHPSPKI